MEGHVAGGAAAALGGESSHGTLKWRGRRRQDGVWSGVACARSDSLKGRARPGEVRGRPGWLYELGRKGGGGPLRKIKMIFFLFLK